MQYFFANDGQQRGPFPVEALSAQGLRPDSLVWREGMLQWQPANSLPELALLFVESATDTTEGGTTAPAGAAPVVTPTYPAGTYPPANAPLDIPAAALATLQYQGINGAQGYYGPIQPPSGMAIAALVLGIVSIPMTCVYGIGLPCAVLAIVLGHIARSKARRGLGSGEGMAMAGLCCGYFAICMLLVMIIGVIVLIARQH